MSQQKPSLVKKLFTSHPGQDIDFGGKSFNTSERAVRGATSQSWGTSNWTGTTLYEGYGSTYADIYHTQPNVRTVVDFLARNIAQLNIKAYKRDSDTERTHLPEHPAEKLLHSPNFYTTRYRMMRDTVADLAIYDNAYWVKVRTADGKFSLVRVQPSLVSVHGSSLLSPSHYSISPYMGSSGERLALDPADVIHFRGYDPADARAGYPPLETLRRTLAQEDAAGRHMEGYWNKAARREGYVQRPVEAGDWSPEAARRFREDFTNQYSGSANSGRPIVLEDGMTWHDSSFSPKDSEWAEGRRLGMEIVVRAFHIPLPMVGLLSGSQWGVDEYHKMLYTETLAPWLTMFEEDFELQLLPEFGNSKDVYFEFNLDEKLKGSFEQQAALAQTLTGGPVVTANELRARMNLPPIEGGDELRTTPGSNVAGTEPPLPLPDEEVEDEDEGEKALGFKAATPITDEAVADYAAELERELRKFFTHQRDSLIGEKALRKDWDDDRWNRELSEKLVQLSGPIVGESGRKAARRFQNGTFVENLTSDWVAETSRVRAENINDTTKANLAAEGAVASAVFEDLVDVRSAGIAATVATVLTNFASHEAAHQSGVKSKTWVVTNLKSRHPQLNGETVAVDGVFSNGARWPGDSVLGIAETARCQCLLSYE
jgi:HK97 family phage portal protein